MKIEEIRNNHIRPLFNFIEDLYNKHLNEKREIIQSNLYDNIVNWCFMNLKKTDKKLYYTIIKVIYYDCLKALIKGCEKEDFENIYRIALEELKGNNTIEKLDELFVPELDDKLIYTFDNIEELVFYLEIKLEKNKMYEYEDFFDEFDEFEEQILSIIIDYSCYNKTSDIDNFITYKKIEQQFLNLNNQFILEPYCLEKEYFEKIKLDSDINSLINYYQVKSKIIDKGDIIKEIIKLIRELQLYEILDIIINKYYCLLKYRIKKHNNLKGLSLLPVLELNTLENIIEIIINNETMMKEILLTFFNYESESILFDNTKINKVELNKYQQENHIKVKNKETI